ncbi:MAG: hypothetical protein ACLSWY_12260 [Ruthenibacterium lactatiformans]
MGFIGENGAGKTTTIKSILACCTRTEAPSRYWGATLSRTAAPSGRISALCWTAAFLRGACARRISGRDEPPAQPMGQRVVRVVLRAVRSAHGKTV